MAPNPAAPFACHSASEGPWLAASAVITAGIVELAEAEVEAVDVLVASTGSSFDLEKNIAAFPSVEIRCVLLTIWWLYMSD